MGRPVIGLKWSLPPSSSASQRRQILLHMYRQHTHAAHMQCNTNQCGAADSSASQRRQILRHNYMQRTHAAHIWNNRLRWHAAYTIAKLGLWLACRNLHMYAQTDSTQFERMVSPVLETTTSAVQLCCTRRHQPYSPVVKPHDGLRSYCCPTKRHVNLQ
jgi:hypothetical protein